ncbi:restriction endonuclease subunit S [Crocosphaera sp. XPORK-15E]|uniref:restriction endonuclease subunit S n=1 Tax=Crocosphaera sp. XPORK-15E TaxID=3110247 RepID=UPI002B1F84B4|nr:restriction endonuclease subunit S [Crocosphaera sp. XPORK-15E]MEA5536112.1 restriction endonuclease subunit S [Crocosphaera sp. XPORK-15E]
MGNYQGYQKYKDSGVEWLGDIPEHWQQKRFKFSVNLINNKIEAENSNLSYMGLEHIDSWTGKRIEDKNASSEGIGSHFLPNDVLFGKLRPYLAKVYLSEIEGLASTEALVLRCKNNIFPKFLKYYILSRDFINIVDSSTFGAKMPRASWDFIGNLFFTFPPLDEQEKIAQFLDYKTKQIDELIKKKETLIEKLDEKRTALISHAVTKGLDLSVTMKDSGIEWLGDIPKHWTINQLGRLTEEINDINHEMPVAVDQGIPFLSAKDLLDDGTLNFEKDIKKISEEDFIRLSKKICPTKNDIIYSRIGACLGKARIVEVDIKFLISYSCCVIRFCQELANPLFFKYFLDSELVLTEARLRTQGIGVPDLGLKQIAKFTLSVPPLDEQKQIAEYLDQKTTQIDQQKAKIKEAIELLKEYRTSLITNAVTGKIDVRQVAIP